MQQSVMHLILSVLINLLPCICFAAFYPLGKPEKFANSQFFALFHMFRMVRVQSW